MSLVESMTNLDAAAVEKMFDSSVSVKYNKFREVRCCGKYFIKFDRRDGHGFKKEFAISQRLEQAGIPVVKHVFCGKTSKGNYLVTEAFSSGMTVDKYLRKNIPPMEFFQRITDLICELLKKGFLHRDFHLGNLLYDQESDRFALVDVRAVNKLPNWILKRVPLSVRLHVLKEFRSVLLRPEMVSLFKRAGIENPGEFYDDMLEKDNEHIRKNWQRRRKQILNGYAKFSIKDGNFLLDSSASAEELANAVPVPGGKAVFLANFFMDLIQMPHRYIVKYDVEKDTAYAAVEKEGLPGGEATLEMIGRLNLYDIETSPSDWYARGAGLPVLGNLEKLAAESFILGEK